VALLTALVLTLAATVYAVVTGPGAPTTPPSRSTVGPLPAQSAPAPVAGPVLGVGTGGPPPSSAALRRALAPASRAPVFSGVLAGMVIGADGTPRYAVQADGFVPPASTAKLATAVAALTALPPGTRLVTRVVLAGRKIVLVGGGDPTLASPAALRVTPGRASLDALARRTASALRQAGTPGLSLGFDTRRYAGPATGPGWKPGYLTQGDVERVSPLMLDEGRVRPDRRARVADPAAAAATAFAGRLAAYGIRVAGRPRPAVASAGARPLASVASPPIPDLVETMLTDSDNDIAEALGREVAGHYGLPRSFAGGAAGVRRGVSAAGVDPAGLRLVDASGLSPTNRVRPRALTALLLAAVRRPALRPLLSGLPVAGFTGTLGDRFRRPPAAAAAGLVRAKTGTLTGVSALAGVVLDRSGALLAFAFVAPKTTARKPAQAALDRLAAILAGCGCR